MSQAATQSPEYRKLLESYNKLRELYSNLYNILVFFYDDCGHWNRTVRILLSRMNPSNTSRACKRLYLNTNKL